MEEQERWLSMYLSTLKKKEKNSNSDEDVQYHWVCLTFSEQEILGNSFPGLCALISDNREWERMAKPDVLRECICNDETFL